MSKISVLTVTYGDRWQFLSRVIELMLGYGQVGNIIVVNNASTYNVSQKVAELNDSRITVINSEENLGSAGGYKAAIKYAFEHTNSDLFFLLDDDNLPRENVIPDLLKNWEIIAGANNKKAFFCLREDRAKHVKITQGEDPYRYYLVPNNFLGFSVFNILKNQVNKLNDKLNKSDTPQQPATIPYAPYGGMFMHRELIADIGYPNEDMYLYVDDSEYTYRITQNGGKIWIIPQCRIVDIDKSQGIGYKKKPFHSALLDQWNFRIYYHIRNRMYFYSQVAVKSKLLFSINKALYLGYLKAVSLISSKQKEYKKLLGAVNDGLSGNLGKADETKF
ncbi:glycosyltransferase family 2 protein [Mucilaginibacter sp.]